MENLELVPGAIRVDEAVVEVTYAGQHGRLREVVKTESPDNDLRGWVAEALRGGDVPGIGQVANPNLADFVVERFQPNDAYPYARIMLRPKTPFGG